MNDGTENLIVIGLSAGGLKALSRFLPQLPGDFSVPIVIVQHIAADAGDYLSKHLNKLSRLPVHETVDKQPIDEGVIYLAPAGYHLQVESDRTFSLSLDQHVNYSRPSIDVLFESAADVYGIGLTAIVLTGANSDGAKGLRRVNLSGGTTIVQDPTDAEYPTMPLAAIASTVPDHIAKLDEIALLLTARARFETTTTDPIRQLVGTGRGMQ